MKLTTQSVVVQTNGDSMPCHLARPATGEHPGLIVVMEAFGLNQHIKKITERFAAEGFVALAPDLYFRQPNNVVPYDDLGRALQLRATLRDEQTVGDMAAAACYLLALAGVKPALGVVGFCMGGRIAFLTACRNPAVKAAVPFYGGGMTRSDPSGSAKAPVEYVQTLRAPVLAFFGALDRHIPAAEVEEFRQALSRASKPAQVVVYPDADHGFMCDERASHHPVRAKQSWDKTIAFLSQNLGA